MNRIRNQEKYIEALEEVRPDAMKQYCDENHINCFSEMVDDCRRNHPEWIHTLLGPGGRRAMITYFKHKQIKLR